MLVLQKLFEDYFHSHNLSAANPQKFSINTIRRIDEIRNFDENLFEQILTKLPENQKKIDSIISVLAPEWPVDKISNIDLQILRMAILEGFILKITPEKVAIDEAIELTKKFSNDQSRKFISGVLGNLIENKSKYIT